MKLSSPLKFLGKKRFVGCDLGSASLKIVKLQVVEGHVRLLGQSIFNVPDTLGDEERSDKIQTFLSQSRFSLDGRVVVNIEDPTLFIRRMDLPKMPDRDLLTAIRWNFRQFVSGSVEDCIVNYLPITGTEEGDKLPFSAFCIARQAVEHRQALFKSAGVRAVSVEPNATALFTAFTHSFRHERDRYYAVLDLGHAVSNFVVIGNNCLLFSRPLGNLSGRRLVDLVVKALIVEREVASDRLNNFLAMLPDASKMQEGSADPMREVLSDFISKLIVEIQRSIDAFCLMYRKERVDRLLLCGGGICLPDIVGRLQSGLGLEVEFLNPFRNVLDAETAQQTPTAPLYAVAVGLALPGE